MNNWQPGRDERMANVYFSFLGLGSKNSENGIYSYTPAVYSLNGHVSKKVDFVQEAELELLKPVIFDRVIIATTRKAADTHFEKLKSTLSQLGYSNVELLVLEEDMSVEGQWVWFEQILTNIGNKDELTVDLTHGYRSIPIIFSTAVNFMQRAKNITLNHVFYGAFGKNQTIVPIIDMKDFFTINMWADGFERLAEDADAGKIIEIATNVPEYQLTQVNDEVFIELIRDITNRIRNVDINNVPFSARHMIDNILQKKHDAGTVEALLFNLLFEKYHKLAGKKPLRGYYDKDYFYAQLELIKLYNEHKLYMQSFTAMREFIGSLGLIGIKASKYSNEKGRRNRRKYGEIFIGMMQWPEEEWIYFNQNHPKYTPENEKHAAELMSFYSRLKELGIVVLLREFVREMTYYRNRLDHAWTEWAGFDEKIIEKAPFYHMKLKEVVDKLNENNLFG
jgi:CRISPR-associated DxTHG motif protein